MSENDQSAILAFHYFRFHHDPDRLELKVFLNMEPRVIGISFKVLLGIEF